MSRKSQSTLSTIEFRPSTRKGTPCEAVSSLYQLRSAVAVSEDEDAGLNGMTKSLDRRLLALNLQPIRPGSEFGYMKVA